MQTKLILTMVTLVSACFAMTAQASATHTYRFAARVPGGPGKKEIEK